MDRPTRVSSPPRRAARENQHGDKLDVTFAPDGGVQKLIQTRQFRVSRASANPTPAARSAFADVATYTPGDEMLVLTGSPRVIDGGMTTTATQCA